MRKSVLRSAVVAVGLLIPSITMLPTSGAVGHPDHVQKERADGPAAKEIGADRGNPNGSNGTIKIDGVDFDGAFDAHPNNEPHIGCQFEVDMYGFDEGDVATLEFREWNPTDDKEPILSLSTENDGDDLGEDGAGGGVDIDDENYVDLEPVLTGDPHPVHGHHVRVDAIVTSGDREYSKTKVFWTGICEATGSGSGSGGS